MFLFPPRLADADLRPLAGNHVIIQCGSSFVVLAHLRRDSVRVQSHARVEQGAQIGEVGNSGNSLVPHLHLEARDGPNPLTARLVPLRLRRCERWTGGAWEEMDDAGLEAGARIRVNADR